MIESSAGPYFRECSDKFLDIAGEDLKVCIDYFTVFNSVGSGCKFGNVCAWIEGELCLENNL